MENTLHQRGNCGFALREKCPNTEFFSVPYFPVLGPKTPYLDTFHAVLVTFTEEILDGKLHFFCAVIPINIRFPYQNENRIYQFLPYLYNFSLQEKSPNIEVTLVHNFPYTAQKMKFSIKNFRSKYDQIWSHLLEKSLMENLIFCAVLFRLKM